MKGTDAAAHADLARALAAVCDTPTSAAAGAGVLGLGALLPEDFTRVFVLNCPPYASIHLGAEGALGGAGADRAAGFWRVLGLLPDADADHLASLLALYAELLEIAAGRGSTSKAREKCTRVRHALLWEHLWSWVPGYTRAVEQLGVPALTRWARLLRRLLGVEVSNGLGQIEEGLPAALRDAPLPLSASAGLGDLLDAAVAPLRSGVILTRDTLALASRTMGIGFRVGERRFALQSMLEQDAPATLSWLEAEASRWVVAHRSTGRDPATEWWRARASNTAAVAIELATSAVNAAARDEALDSSAASG